MSTKDRFGAFQLCYVEGSWAYFTSRNLKEQWGDDWNDSPYEHNAGTPYSPHHDDIVKGRDWAIIKVAWDGPLLEPRDGQLNSPYSVEQINSGAIAWLRSDASVKPPVAIPAGTTLGDFKALVKQAGGSVYQDA